jgi:predicted polyphosphate/ATP-dependent NAD kinase
MVRAKTSGPADDVALDALARVTARRMDPDRAYILGPGTTTARVLRALGLSGTLLGVDVVRGGRMVIADAGEAELLEVIGGGPATIIAGVVGGQGFLFGRGNQQISAEVIRQVGIDNIEILADAAKLSQLSPPWLRVDTGDQDVDRLLAGYRKVHVAPQRATILKIST